MPACAGCPSRSSIPWRILGGQLTTLYPEKYIYDVPGFPRVLAEDLAASLAEQAGQYKPAICLGDRVEMLRREGEAGPFIIHTQI